MIWSYKVFKHRWLPFSSKSVSPSPTVIGDSLGSSSPSTSSTRPSSVSWSASYKLGFPKSSWCLSGPYVPWDNLWSSSDLFSMSHLIFSDRQRSLITYVLNRANTARPYRSGVVDVLPEIGRRNVELVHHVDKQSWTQFCALRTPPPPPRDHTPFWETVMASLAVCARWGNRWSSGWQGQRCHTCSAFCGHWGSKAFLKAKRTTLTVATLPSVALFQPANNSAETTGKYSYDT